MSKMPKDTWEDDLVSRINDSFEAFLTEYLAPIAGRNPTAADAMRSQLSSGLHKILMKEIGWG